MSDLTFESLNAYLSGRISFIGTSKHEDKGLTPRIICADGVELSVQTGIYLYCSPRENIGPWFQVEVGYPSICPPDTWRGYFDGDWEEGDRTASVYGYVPIDLVIDFINEHGGADLTTEERG